MGKSGRKSVFLAIDLGASSGRVVAGVFNNSILGLEIIHRFENGPLVEKDGIFWDIRKLYSEIIHGISRAAAKYKQDIVSIGVCTWGVDYALLDSKMNLIGNPRNYRDSRTKGVMEKVFSIVPRKQLYDITGIQMLEINTIFQLFSERLCGSGHLESACRLLFIPDIINFWLSGVAANEKTIAGTSQLMDLRSGDWSDEIIERLKIPGHIFSDIVEPGTVLGPLSAQIAGQTGLKTVNVVAVGGHDTASAVAATPLQSRNEAYLSSGTWSLMGAELESPLINDNTLRYNFTNETGVFETVRFLKNITGMWPIQECRRTWKEEGIELSFDDMVELAASAPRFTAFVDIDSSLFSSPGNLPAKLADYCRETGQKVPDSRGGIIRVFLESLAFKYREIFTQLENLTGKKYTALRVVGGGAKNDLLNRFIANAIDRTVISGPFEATAIGNIIVQLMANKDISSLAEGREVVGKSFDNFTYNPEDVDAWNVANEKYQSFNT